MTTVTVNLDEVRDRVIAALDETYDFTYVAYDDHLTVEQVEKLLDPETHDEQADEIDYAWQEGVLDYNIPEAIRELVKDDVEWAALRANHEFMQPIEEAILERAEWDPMPDLIRHTGNVLLRYRLGSDDDDRDLANYAVYGDNDTDANRERHARRMARLAGVPYEGENAAVFRQMVLEQGYYGGSLYVIWYGPVDELINIVGREVCRARSGGERAKRRIIRWTNPDLVLLDTWNGSGYGDTITGTISKVLDVDRLCTDKHGGGYGWDHIAGLVLTAFKNDPTITGGPVE